MNQASRLLLAVAVVIACASRQGLAQWDYLDVPQGYETLNLAVEGDTTATGDAKSLNRVYRLARGGVYLMNGHLTSNKGAPVRIFAADGAGAKPLIIMAVNQSGANDDFIYIEGDAHLKNLFISGIDNIGKQDRYTMAIYDSAARVILDGVHIDHSRQSHLRTYGKDNKIYFLNCEFRNSIDLATPSNGRFYDGRGIVQDSIVYVNSTLYLNSQRMFRTDGAITKNIVFDHNTFYLNAYGSNTSSGLKQSGPIETGKAVNARITNNIFQDLGTEAMRHPKTMTPADRMPIIHIDSLGSTTYPESSRKWVVRNNAYGWSQGFKTFWATIDTVKPPEFISPYGRSAFFTGNPNIVESGNFEELIQFADGPGPDSLLKYTKYRFSSNFNNVGNPDPRADRNGIGDLTTAPGTFGPETNPYNFDYPTSQKAYTAADGGFPVGDLNWFPSKKTQWELWVTGVEDRSYGLVDYRLEQNYPNPFNPVTQIEYSLPKAMPVSLVIYNALGQKIRILVDHQQSAPGSHQVEWNGRDNAGNMVGSGVYYYRLQAGDSQITRKMMLLK